MTKLPSIESTSILRNTDPETRRKITCRRNLTQRLAKKINTLLDTSKNLALPIVYVDKTLDNPLDNLNFSKMITALHDGTSSPRKISYNNNGAITTESNDYSRESAVNDIDSAECMPTIAKAIKDILYTQGDLDVLNKNSECYGRTWVKHPKFNVIIALEYIRHQLIIGKNDYLCSALIITDLDTVNYLVGLYAEYTDSLQSELADILQQINNARNLNLKEQQASAAQYISIARNTHSNDSEPACWGLFQFNACRTNEPSYAAMQTRHPTEHAKREEVGVKCSIM